MRETKDSNIKWVGAIPSTWTTELGKHFMTCLDRPVREDDGVITCFRDGEVTLRSKRREEGFTVSFQEIGYQGIEPGDLVVHGMDGFAGAIGISDSRGKATPVLNVLDTEQDKRYMMYALRNMAYTDVFLALSTGIRVRSCDTSWKKLRSLEYALPPLDEQRKIADKIEQKSKQVDALIANQQAQIEKLKQYKQSLITEVVTKGLEPNAPMKDSGIEWLETIPKCWQVAPLKSLFTFGKGLPITKDNLIESGVPVISYGQIHAKWNSGVTIHEELKRFVSDDYLSTNPNSLVKKGDFIMADTSEDREGCGNCAYVDSEGQLFAGYHTIILNSIEGSNNKYLAYLFRTDAWRSQIRKRVSGVKLFSISRRILGDVSVVLPPEEEVHRMLAFLDDKCSKVDKLVTIKQRKIEELNRYKKALIYEYVTGKKEVV
jgi:type I restriction enzyme S subunit